MHVAKGASVETATKLAEELTAHDAFAAHIDAELGIDPNALNNPWHAQIFPVIAFTVGSILPIVAIQLPPAGTRVPATLVVALLALTGEMSANLGGARWARQWPASSSPTSRPRPSHTASASSSELPASE